jgi:phosphate transport system substrate-binding protein
VAVSLRQPKTLIALACAVVVVATGTAVGLKLLVGNDQEPDAAPSPSVSVAPSPSASQAASATATPTPTPTPTPSPTGTAAPCTTAPADGYEFAFNDRDCFPLIDASTATHPLALAFIEAFTGVATTAVDQGFTKTDSAYHRLIDGEVDLILVTQPSEDELAYAAAQGVTLEVTPVVREGFVFLTNPANPVEGLTQDQVVGIYSGEITDWSEVGGPAGEIAAYQRPENSGSQTGMLELVMGDTALADPPMDFVVGDMGGLIDAVASYDNQGGAIGYSYYYYVTAMYGTDAQPAAGRTETKLLAIDGVAPSSETISAQDYPYTTAYYMVYRQSEPAGSPARLVSEAMLASAGQQTAAAAGYVPLAPEDLADGAVSGSAGTLYGTAAAGSGVQSLDEQVAWTCPDRYCQPVYLLDPATTTLQELFLEGTDIKAALMEGAQRSGSESLTVDDMLGLLTACDLTSDEAYHSFDSVGLSVCGVDVRWEHIYQYVTRLVQPYEGYSAQDASAVPYLVFTELSLAVSAGGDPEACRPGSDAGGCRPYWGLQADNLMVASSVAGLVDSELDLVLPLAEAWVQDMVAMAQADPSHFYIATAWWGYPETRFTGDFYQVCGEGLCQDLEIAQFAPADRLEALRVFGRSDIWHWSSTLVGPDNALGHTFSAFPGDPDIQVDITPVTVP